MDGFKNSTKTQYMQGGSVKRAEAKMGKVMGEFAAGKLHSGSKKGPEVKNPKQAVAIAMSEARKAGAKMPMKKAIGGGVDAKLSRNITNTKAHMDRMAAAPSFDPSKPSSGSGSMLSALLGKKPTPPTKGSDVVASPRVRGPSMSPAFSARPMVRRSKGGLTAMPKGKC